MILITGGAGFIGSVLVHELNKRGREDIVIVDNFGHGNKWKNLLHAKFYDFLGIDEFKAIFSEELMSSIDFIFHLGACSSTTEVDMDYLYENNTRFSQLLFEMATELDIPIVYASSAATYGNGSLGYRDDHQKMNDLRPLNPYGFSKYLFDSWVLSLEERPTHWFGVKFFNVFGPNEHHKGDMRSMVCRSYEQIKEKGYVRLFKSHRPDYDDGMQQRDFVYVKDVVAALIQMMRSDKARYSGIYNLGTGESRTFLDLVRATFSSMGREEKITFFDMPENIRDQYQYFTEADMSKFNKAFPKFVFNSLEQSVDDYDKNHLLRDDL